MAETPDQVLGFLNDLAAKAKPQGEREVEALRQFAEQEYGVSELQLWDVAYYSEKQNSTCLTFPMKNCVLISLKQR